jgi:hypothetical protein
MPTFNIRMEIQATIRAESDPVIMLPQVERGLDRVTAPDREDDGIQSFDLEGITSTLVVARLVVAANDPNAAEGLMLASVKRGLDPITNYLREDDGLMSFALTVTEVFPACDAADPSLTPGR